ncbi:MAG: S41 family peptidase [Planctomycetia bacterium]|nr:S41 family peptidase [Planctomycetia bacterium]
MNVVSPPTWPARRPPGLRAAGILAILIAVLCPVLSPADEPVPGWSVSGTAEPIEDVAAKTARFEREGRWADVVAACEAAARKGTLAPELRERYDLAKIHCDLVRRHTESAYRTQLARLAEPDARRLYAEVLARIASHHVEPPNFARTVSRGLLALDVAIDEPAFAAVHVPATGAGPRGEYRSRIAELAAGRTVGSQVEAETFAAWVASIAHGTLGIEPSVTFLEMTAAAMGGLDEYSAFLTTGQLDDLYAQIEGNFVGLGVELKAASDGLLVVHVIAGSPAQRAGIRPGDHLVGVGGQPLGGMGVDQAAQLLQGPPGSLVTLAVLRAPAPARAVTVRREHVEVPSVEDARMADADAGVAYVKVTSFQKTTAADLEAALRRLDTAGMRTLVVDLRGNPGGLLSAAVDVADLFLERGLVVATRGRSPEEDFNYTASRPGTWRMPLVVVIDGDSASSSEIFAGAIRDHGRGTIVGTRSYGKGSIQGIFPLESAGVGMRLTTAKFFSPNGKPYSGVGVEPHLAVHAAARPAGGVALVGTGGPPAADPFLDTAVEAARRSLPRPAARPPSRTTAVR